MKNVINRLKHRLATEPVFRRLLRNISWLFSTHFLIGVIGMATLAFTARTIGASGLGILAIVEAYVRIVDRLLRLEPWQATIRYGVEALEIGDSPRFLRLVKLSIVIDLAGGLLAGSAASPGD